MFLSVCLEKRDLKSSKVRGSLLGAMPFGRGIGGEGTGKVVVSAEKRREGEKKICKWAGGRGSSK